jgi:branched-chain amino acid transport system ATP-binding protein
MGVDLAVESGQAVAVLGANGAGKTTLARVISGSLAPASGAVAFDGRPVAGLGAHRVAELGVAHCMEGRRVFPTLSVEENLRIAVRGADGATIGLARSTTSFLCSRSARIHRGPQCRAGSSRCSQLPAR